MATASKILKIDPDQSWHKASKLIKNCLHFASSFSTTIRILKQNEYENQANGADPYKLNEQARFSAMRLFKAPSIKAPLYFLTATFKSEELENKTYISTEELAGLYKVDELSAILTLVYIFNSLRKSCDKEEWTRYSKYINEAVEIGGYFGNSIPQIGFASGILLTGLRYMAPAVFLAREAKAFKNYRRDVKIKKAAFDLQLEYDIFGCTHVDIATQMLQLIGYGVNASSDLYKSLMTDPKKPLEHKSNMIRVMLLWVEALSLGKKPPPIYGENEISITDDVLDRLVLLNKQIQESGSAHSWLSKGKSSISKTLTPVLYKNSGAPAAGAEEMAQQASN